MSQTPSRERLPQDRYPRRLNSCESSYDETTFGTFRVSNECSSQGGSRRKRLNSTRTDQGGPPQRVPAGTSATSFFSLPQVRGRSGCARLADAGRRADRHWQRRKNFSQPVNAHPKGAELRQHTNKNGGRPVSECYTSRQRHCCGRYPYGIRPPRLGWGKPGSIGPNVRFVPSGARDAALGSGIRPVSRPVREEVVN